MSSNEEFPRTTKVSITGNINDVSSNNKLYVLYMYLYMTVRVMRALEHVKQRPRFCQISLLTMTTTTTIGTMCIASMFLTKLSSAKGNEKMKKERKKETGRKRAQEKVRRFSRRALVYFCTPSHFKGGSLIR